MSPGNLLGRGPQEGLVGIRGSETTKRKKSIKDMLSSKLGQLKQFHGNSEAMYRILASKIFCIIFPPGGQGRQSIYIQLPSVID